MTNKILSLIPLAQSVALAKENFKIKKNLKTKDILSKGVKNLVSISLIKETANVLS